MQQVIENGGKWVSPYAQGIALRQGPPGPGSGARDFSGRAYELLSALVEAKALTQEASANILKCSRRTANSALKTLWYAGMARWVDVFTAIGPFRLWLPAESRPPLDAQEACRLAVYGLFFSLAKNEVPGFSWQLVKARNSPLQAQMAFNGANGPEKWLIDAPRLDEEINPVVDVYILPMEGRKREIPGKKFILDELLLQPGMLKEKIKLA
ncbi:hypothetical protein MTHERMOG20_23600 [Moorella thermoacetica]|nr:hypothetical protein [Moorella thermoacetica]AKX95745.1 hypothetical protein MOTHA_c03760 [Moorella thermoacetica]OIQ54580.1 hypothetical protein MOCA_22490 [Moorella thermoacetica]QCZ99555.1 hypothetical protein MothHH_00385 [Moorella thermoacetica]TYL07215.1 hypothetical protein MOOCA_23230 [Moorella thermoacetica]TYL07581.1 hypothetical protein MOLA_22420 [Moorella thermoacetica]